MAKQKHFLTLRTRLIFLPGVLALCMFFAIQVLPVRAVRAETWSFVRVVHASPDAGIVDVFMDGKKILSNFQFGTITGYSPVTAGTHKLQIAVIGTGAAAAVLTQAISVEAGIPYTVAALGTKDSGFSLQVFADNNVITSNKAKVRVYHLSPGTGVVNVENGGNMLISGLSYAKASDYVTFPAGAYTFNVIVSQANATLQVPAQLKAWTVTSIFAVGASQGNAKLQIVDSSVNGVPGMPGTGSDPHALSVVPQAPVSWPWLFVGLVLMIVVTGLPMHRLVTARKSRRDA